MLATQEHILAETGEFFTCASPTIKSFVIYLDSRTFDSSQDRRRDFILDRLPADPRSLFIKRGTLTYTVNIGKGREETVKTTYKNYIKKEINTHICNTNYLSTKQRKHKEAEDKKIARAKQREIEDNEKKQKKAKLKLEKDKETRKKLVAGGKELAKKGQLARERKRQEEKAEAELKKKGREERKKKKSYEEIKKEKQEKIKREAARRKQLKEEEEKRKRDREEARDRSKRRRVRE